MFYKLEHFMNLSYFSVPMLHPDAARDLYFRA